MEKLIKYRKFTKIEKILDKYDIIKSQKNNLEFAPRKTADFGWPLPGLFFL